MAYINTARTMLAPMPTSTEYASSAQNTTHSTTRRGTRNFRSAWSNRPAMMETCSPETASKCATPARA